MANARWRPPYDFLAARATFMNTWPQAWRDLSPAFEILWLSPIEINALGYQISGFHHWFSPASAEPLHALARRIDAAIAGYGRSCFIRLTTRSPKDSLWAECRGMQIHNGAQALGIIMHGSERCAADLRMALDQKDSIGLVVREWIDFLPHMEFRCFMRDRRWMAASQMGPNATSSLLTTRCAQRIVSAVEVQT